MEKNTAAIEKLKEDQQETRGELEAVKEGCKLRHEEMTGIVRELGLKAETWGRGEIPPVSWAQDDNWLGGWVSAS